MERKENAMIIVLLIAILVSVSTGYGLRDWQWYMGVIVFGILADNMIEGRKKG